MSDMVAVVILVALLFNYLFMMFTEQRNNDRDRQMRITIGGLKEDIAVLKEKIRIYEFFDEEES